MDSSDEEDSKYIGRNLFSRKRRGEDDIMEQDDEEDGILLRKRSHYISPIPRRQHSNYNPFASTVPNLLNVSTTSPENSSLEDSSPQVRQNQLCKEFKKTLSFVEFVDEDDESTTTNTPPEQTFVTNSPVTPPSNSIIHANFPKSAMKTTLRFTHRSSNIEENSKITSRFDDEFEILGQLGGGSFGSVYKCKKRLDGCMYAVKMVKQPFQSTSGRERVLKEVYALAALVNNSDNLHVVRYFSSWIDIDDRLYIQTELCDMSLEDLLKRFGSNFEHSDIEQVACEILRQLLLGLKGLHGSNVVHLDIKPANILVKNDTYKLGDLGHVAMARVLPDPPPIQFEPLSMDEDRLTMIHEDEEDERQRNAICSVVQDVDEGDVRYMARELLNEDRQHLPKADIFSLAASVYEIFLQKPPPATGEEWAALREGHLSHEATSKMSNNFKQLLHLMMHPDPARRPTAEALLLTGGPGGILLGQEQLGRDRLKREVDLWRGLHPSQAAILRRANTM